MNSALRRAVTIGFAVAIALLIGANAYVLTRDIDTSPVRGATPNGASPSGAATVISDADISPSSVAESLERPLFNAGRRPAPLPVSASQDADKTTVSQPDALTFVGTMRWGSSHLALIRAASDPLARWISIGGTVDGWTLKGIERDFIVVKRASREVQIPILQKQAPQSAGTAD